MSRFLLLAALLFAAAAQVTAATRVEISSRLLGYDLAQATGTSSTVNDLPRVVVRSGSEGLVQVAREWRYPKEFNAKGRPTVLRIAYLGIRMPIYVREHEDNKVKFIMRVELCEREDPTNPLSAVLKTTTTFQGQTEFGRQVSVTVGAPGGRKAVLELTMSRR
jgi:hypothetical protein